MSEKEKEVEDAIRVRKYEDLFDDEQSIGGVINEQVLGRREEEFSLMFYELIKEFVKKPGAQLLIEMRDGVTFALYSKDEIEFDLKLSCVKFRSVCKRTHFKPSTELCFEYVPEEKIQIIRLDDIISVSLNSDLDELERW